MQKNLRFATLSLPTILHTNRKIWYNEGIKSKGECHKMTVVWIVLGVLAVIVLWAMFAYNGLVQQKNWVQEAWAQIDVQLQRRNDLVPNLVETVKGYAAHESKTLEAVVAARNAVAGSSTTEEKLQNENILTGTLRSLFAVAEAYPELKANENFKDLMNQLNNVEEDIANSRKYYNAVVKRFNIKCRTFPSAIVAKIFNFSAMPMFEVQNEAERENVKVSF